MRSFYLALTNNLIVTVTNSFVWFALTFWGYLETHSVLFTSILSGVYLAITALSSFWFGSIVDHHKKKPILMISTTITTVIFAIGLLTYLIVPQSVFAQVGSPMLWVFAVLLLVGVLIGNIRNIVIPTLVTILVDEKHRDKANGLSGMVSGLAFSITSVASGITLAYLGMSGVLSIALALSALSIVQLVFINIPEKGIAHLVNGVKPPKLDIKGTMKAIAAVPGLFALILFSSFNNFLGGVFMSLMDAYGLTLVSVQRWGLLWGILSFGFIAGGMYVAKRGLGKNPLTMLFAVNIIMWVVTIFFTIQASIILLATGMFIWMSLMPIAQAAEQTIIQKVVPIERQGRIFGFAASVEQAASPITSFLIGPIAQFLFIPFMTTGAGVELIGGWFGVGIGRGIALVFIATGIIGLLVTSIAMRSKSYKLLAARYIQK